MAAVRLRLGAGGPSEAVPCASCGDALLGPSGLHAMLCARGPSTRGHNAVRDTVHALALAGDHAAEFDIMDPRMFKRRFKRLANVSNILLNV